MKIGCVYFCWKCHQFLVFLAALMCQSGRALAVSHRINQRNLDLCHTLPHSFIVQEGAKTPSFGLINSCSLMTSWCTAGSHLCR